MLFKVSRAFVLCRGLLWTSRVKALSLSESVPDWIILDRKFASDADELDDEDVWKVWISVACRLEARVMSEASCVALTAGKDAEAAPNGGADRYQCEAGEIMNLDLGSRVTFEGSWTLGSSTAAGTSAGASNLDASFFFDGGAPGAEPLVAFEPPRVFLFDCLASTEAGAADAKTSAVFETAAFFLGDEAFGVSGLARGFLFFFGALDGFAVSSEPSCPPRFKPFRNCDTSFESVGWKNRW